MHSSVMVDKNRQIHQHRGLLSNTTLVRITVLLVLAMSLRTFLKNSNIVPSPPRLVQPNIGGSNPRALSAESAVPAATANITATIPQVLYQSWITKHNMPAQMAAAVQSWVDMNSDYRVVFFNDTEQRHWMKENCQMYWPAWRDMEMPAARADLFRYCLLYQNGGVWADVDMQPKLALSVFLPKNAKLVVVHDGGMKRLRGDDCHLYNAFLASVPKHPVLKRAMDIIKLHHDRRVVLPVVDATGPGVLWRAVKDTLKAVKPIEFVGLDEQHGIEYMLFSNPYIESREKGNVLIAKYGNYLNELQKYGVEPHLGQLVNWATPADTT